ncbi:lipid A deacylase LpxR family protein [Marinomonas sp. M1K-6]|uniref:Lipid A deacylase LpxR family protein n=1 Tax=Marinomonas profundi TaxID=2726122 RepID=A0A847RAU0_9GAMM|nr:lipid A deacylase LpxR family protein [Marinomonas profundi]NLQ18337.1 lipid A deacylase LpxR family protein [Marinomonas profundi]UDV02400.1 lipid A deacylase LpxR family protein [Marinomonas profundi]
MVIEQGGSGKSISRKNIRSRGMVSLFRKYCIGFILLSALPAYADINWMSATLDNDFFVNEDNGYTNGIYISFYDVNDKPLSIQAPDIWVKPLMWSMPNSPNVDSTIKLYSLGQTLATPYDIGMPVPPEGSFPYSGLLSFTNAYILVTADYADRVSTTLGVVGPLAMGEQTQKAVHKVISAKTPKGWDTQLENEVVFELSRGRTWRSWVSDTGKMDLLSSVNASVGTLKSAASTGAMLRYGQNLKDSYATALLAESRTSNPIAVNQGWFVYLGLSLNYTFNQIFTDGNTFRDSRSIDYDHNNNMFSSGVTYSWGDAALSFAINSPFSFSGDEHDREMDKYTRYGTFTFAWQL